MREDHPSLEHKSYDSAWANAVIARELCSFSCWFMGIGIVASRLGEAARITVG